MNVAVLCPGPSLKAFDAPVAEYDLVVGVNRAAEAYEVDYWVSLDLTSFSNAKPIGFPTIVSAQHAWDRIGRPAEYKWLLYSDVGLTGADVPFGAFSATTALVLGHKLGATEAHVYGADMAGECDWDGTSDPRNVRTTSRWAREASVWSDLVGLLSKRGTRVVRIPQELS